MMSSIRLSTVLAFASISLLVAAETSVARSVKKDVAPPAAVASPKVEFLEPVNGATVAEKFKVRMNVIGYKIAPLGELEKGKGHHHIVINGGPVEEGKVVPTDEKHIHFGKGQTETELTLPPGKHKLTLQFADGAHRSYGEKLSQTIEVTVQSGK
ncbi:MAG: DUF4399 domain-containing protein [Bdellovibrionales bacterium]|nr:DUF4399 domain-containing protein [Bdellovibrionales bacterium]